MLLSNGSLVLTIELFTIVLDSFHQLSLPTQQLNIICDSRIHGLALSVETRHQLVYELQVLHNSAQYHYWRRKAETQCGHLPSELAKITLRIV